MKKRRRQPQRIDVPTVQCHEVRRLQNPNPIANPLSTFTYVDDLITLRTACGHCVAWSAADFRCVADLLCPKEKP